MSPTLWETLGLTTKEAAIYEFLLRRGELEASPIISELKLKRATVYKSLYALEKKGLITTHDIRKKIHFRPEPPTTLLSYADAKLKQQEQAKNDLRTLIPELTSAYLLAVEKPIVTTFEGVRGLKDIYEDTLREGKPIKAVLQVSTIDPELQQWLDTVYVHQRVKKNIHASVIVASGKLTRDYVERDKKEHRATIQVPAALYPFSHEIDIYGDKVAFIHYKAEEPLIGVVITHPAISQTMNAWFDLAWKGALSHQELEAK